MKDEGSEFCKELNEQVEQYFIRTEKKKTGNAKMFFKIFLYFEMDILFMHLSQSLFLLFTFFMTHHVEETFGGIKSHLKLLKRMEEVAF